MEAMVSLVTFDLAFEVVFERYDESLLRFTVKKPDADDSLENLRRFAFPDEAASYMYERGCHDAWAVIIVGIEAIKSQPAH